MIQTRHKVNVKHDGADVVLSIDGKPVLGSHWRSMERVARTLLDHCGQAKAQERALTLARQKVTT